MRVVLLALVACAHAAAAPSPPGFARSKEQASEVCLPPGEKAYLTALRCGDGSAPAIRRMGSVGSRVAPVDPNDPRILLQMDPERPLQPGEPYFRIVDAVEARCGPLTYTLFFDMYHCPAPAPIAPEGFTLEP